MASFKKNQTVDFRSQGVPKYISQTKETAKYLAKEVLSSDNGNYKTRKTNNRNTYAQVAVSKEK